MKKNLILIALAILVVAPIGLASLIVNYYDGDASSRGASLGSGDYIERCELIDFPTPTTGEFRIHTRVQFAWGTITNLITRIRDTNTKAILMTLDLPDTTNTTLHEEITDWANITPELGSRSNFLICDAQLGQTSTISYGIGYDKKPNSTSWARFGTSWSNTTSTYGDLALWIEYN